MNNNNTTYKDSQLGKIPSDWEVRKIKDIGKITSGTTPLRSNLDYHRNGTISWVKTTDLNNYIVTDTEEKITTIALNDTSLRIYPIDTILVAMYGGFNQIGRTGILGIEATINQALSAITINKNETDPFFLLNWLNAKVGLWKNLAGSSRKDPNITSKDVGDFPFIQMPLPEQKAIAHVLGLMDSAINTNNQLIAKKELQKKWLMQQLLSEKLIVKNEKWCKSGMRKVTIGEIAIVKKGKPIVENEIKKGNIPVIAGGKTSPYSHDEFTDEKVITISASGAYAGFVSFHEREIWASDCPVLKEIDGKLNLHYLFYHLIFNQEKIYKLQRGGAQPHVFPKDIFHFSLFIINSPEEQTAIARVLKAADKEIQLLKAKTERLREQKKGLMQVLLTGKKRLLIETQ